MVGLCRQAAEEEHVSTAQGYAACLTVVLLDAHAPNLSVSVSPQVQLVVQLPTQAAVFAKLCP